MSEFNKGDELTAVSSDGTVTVQELLGSGGQGEVYKVTYSGEDYALKWYFPHTATESQRKSIERLIEDGAPSQSFLWPFELVKSDSSGSYGYLMPLREARFKSFTDIVNGRTDPSFEVLITIGLNLVECFHKLHGSGLCYRDISFGNGFFDEDTGEVVICDNDNVSANNIQSESVLGTPDFMAPEVVLRKARPSRETDYFSLSVLLFYLFHIAHPLLGRKVLSIRSWDLPAREKLFGSEPLFIFDPTDNSNHALSDSRLDPLGEAGKNAIPYWNDIYPNELKDAFLRCFTEGIRDPAARPLATAWKKVLTKSMNSIVACTCGAEVFVLPSSRARSCWSCGTSVAVRFALATETQVICASNGKKILSSHLFDDLLNPMSAVVAEVVTHPKRKDILGLCNRTQGKWTVQPAGSSEMIEVPPGKSVPLVVGTVVMLEGTRLTVSSPV